MLQGGDPTLPPFAFKKYPSHPDASDLLPPSFKPSKSTPELEAADDKKIRSMFVAYVIFMLCLFGALVLARLS